MEKKFSKTEIANIKRIARNAAPYIAKRNNIQRLLDEKKATIEQQVREAVQKRIEKMEARAKADIDLQQKIINSIQSYVVELTGYGIEDLVTKTIEGTGKFDAATGKEAMRTVYALKYPDTVIPTEGCIPEVNEEPANPFEESEKAEEVAAEIPDECPVFAEEDTTSSDPFDNDNWD